MKIISVVLICLCLLACSSTKVHLYTRYLSVQETKKIINNIEKNNFSVIVNTLAFPDDIQQSTLLYSPFVQGEDSLNILINSLDNIGWAIPSVRPLFAGNHYYTKNSVGLLLLPDGVVQSDKVITQDLVNEYQSDKCGISVKLKLARDGSYHFLYSNKTPGQSGHVTGRWKMTSYPYIELTSLNGFWRFYFEIQKRSEVDVVGATEVIELKVVEKHGVFPNCNFVYGLRV